MDGYLSDCEQQFLVTYLKRMNATAEQAWQSVMKSTNAQFHSRGKNTVLECLQFGGNSEFWSGFASEQDIVRYFTECYQYAVQKIGFLKTDENIICAAIVTEPNRRNLFVYYLPITETWTSKVIGKDKSERGNKLQLRDDLDEPLYTLHTDIDAPRLSSTEFWKKRGGMTSFSDLQEDFFQKLSSCYGAERGESKSYLKNTNTEQARRFQRMGGDLYDEPPPYDDLPFWSWTIFKIVRQGLDFFARVVIIVLTFQAGKFANTTEYLKWAALPSEQRRFCPQKSIARRIFVLYGKRT